MHASPRKGIPRAQKAPHYYTGKRPPARESATRVPGRPKGADRSSTPREAKGLVSVVSSPPSHSHRPTKPPWAWWLTGTAPLHRVIDRAVRFRAGEQATGERRKAISAVSGGGDWVKRAGTSTTTACESRRDRAFG